MIPSPEYFQHFYEYVKWADLRQLEWARALSDQAYSKDHGWSFGTIHKVALHMIAAQQTWLDRFEGRPSSWIADLPDNQARESLEPVFQRVHRDMTDFVKRLTAGTLSATIDYRNLKGDSFTAPQWQLLNHVFNHAMHHRGQLNSMIKLSGGTPMQLDYSYYVLTGQAGK